MSEVPLYGPHQCGRHPRRSGTGPVGRELMAPRADRTTRIPSGVAAPVTIPAGLCGISGVRTVELAGLVASDV